MLCFLLSQHLVTMADIHHPLTIHQLQAIIHQLQVIIHQNQSIKLQSPYTKLQSQATTYQSQLISKEASITGPLMMIHHQKSNIRSTIIFMLQKLREKMLQKVPLNLSEIFLHGSTGQLSQQRWNHITQSPTIQSHITTRNLTIPSLIIIQNLNLIIIQSQSHTIPNQSLITTQSLSQFILNQSPIIILNQSLLKRNITIMNLTKNTMVTVNMW